MSEVGEHLVTRGEVWTTELRRTSPVASAATGIRPGPARPAVFAPTVQALVDREVRLLERHGQALVVHDAAGRLVQANDRAIDGAGLRWDGCQLQADEGWEVVGPNGEAVADQDLPNALVRRLGGAVQRVDLGLRGPDGRITWLAVTASPVKADDGEVVAVVTTLGSLEGWNPRQIGASRPLHLAVLTCDDEGRVTYVSPEAEVLYGCRTEDAVGRPAADVVTWDLPPARITRLLAGRGDGEPWSAEVWIRRQDGGSMPAHLTIAPVAVPGGTSLVVTLAIDISAVGALSAAERDESGQDELTGLLSRRRFLDALERRAAVRREDEAPIVLAIFHLEDLRIINDATSSRTGDHVIRMAAHALLDAMHVGDTAGRLSGTSFAVCFQAAGTIDVGEYVARLRRAIALPIPVDSEQISLRCSAGFAASTGDQATAEALLQSADLALARTRAVTRDESLVYEDGLRERMQTDQRIETAIRRALAAGTIPLGYQPIVDMANCRVVEAEALIRLHDQDGSLPAGDVIAVAEHRGLIGELGLLILETACRDAVSWRDGGDHEAIGVCVNVSAKQLDDPHLEAKVRRVLAETGLDPSELNLEMTETVLMDDSTWTAGQLTKLKRLGVRLSADDFGTGYSSLAYLKRFPLDVIKADLSFVAGLPGSVEDTAVVQAIIGLADVLGLAVVAEGVECESQLEALRALGCEFGQGYLWSRAVRASEVRGVAEEVQRRALGARPTGAALPVEPSTVPLAPRSRPDARGGARGGLRRWAEEVADTTEQAGSDGTALAPLVAQARQLVADIDVLAAVDDGSLRLALAVTDLRAVVEEAAARSALEAGAVVRVEPLVVGAALVWCDAGLVERAVRALVDNALQHAPGAAPPLVLVGRRGRWMDIAVHDRGPGIPASRLPLVFSRFGWLDRGANRGGVGLGLTLAREVARLHGGDVVHRNPGDGVGSVFTLRLPAAAEEEAARLVLAAGHSQ